MKLRIRDNSVRFRLTRTEVMRLCNKEPVSSTLKLGEESFSYIVETDTVTSITVSLKNNILRAQIPEEFIIKWGNGPQVSLFAEQIYNDKQCLKILIEKDFFCLKPRSFEEENEEDMYPHPHASLGRC